MSKQNQPPTPEQIMSGLLPTESPVVAPVNSKITANDLQAQLVELQVRDLAKRLGREDEAEQAQKNQRRQTAENMEKARKQLQEAQGYCTHKKPNGQSALGGQRTHQPGQYTFICLYCQKEFNDGKIPPELRLPAERVGGPTV